MFPTPVRTPEIVSSIAARAIGDARLTTYYYTFEGEQGDVFINVQSTNFTGDIDVYVVPSQQPLTKIIIYGDQPVVETGRVIYLRKSERLLLRVQGRSPGDDDASVRIKFAGSFAASRLDDSTNPAIPKVESSTESNVRVNSVGTILEVIPKATPIPDAAVSRVDDEPEKTDIQPEKKDEEIVVTENAKVARSVEVVVTDPVKTDEKPQEATPRRATSATNRTRRSRSAPKPAEAAEDKKPESVTAEVPPRAARTTARQRAAAAKKAEETKVDPMANVRLVVYFKDGSTIDRPMTEVLRFSVERAVLTVIAKNGTIGRYNMTEVTRVSIE